MTTRAVARIDERGRISLKSFGFEDTDVIVETTSDGSLLISRAVVLTETEARHYNSPEAVKALEEGLRSVKAGRVQPMKLRTR
jgi:hypothetical protein